MLKKLSDCFMSLEKECRGNLITASPFSSVSLKQQSVYINGQNSDNLSCNGCHRNSAGSSSSHDSSSGFESMKVFGFFRFHSMQVMIAIFS